MTQRNDATWGKDPHPLISLECAWQHIGDDLKPLDPETVPFDEAAGRVLASPVIASEDYPPFDKAMMDGFAVRAADCEMLGAELEVLGLVAAGQPGDQAVGARQAVRINTGAPVPDGADSVVRVEDTALSEDERQVTIQVAVIPGRHIAKRGSDRRTGDILLASPIRLGSAPLAVAATAGAASLCAYPRPSVAIATTGDELVRPGEFKKPGQIYESNGPMLAELMRQFGAMPHESDIVRDESGDLTMKLSEALRHPVVIAVGGMSMGTHDLVPRTFSDLGVDWRFHGVKIRPGKPVAYGRGPDGQHVFGLPGNPVSAFVCAWLFVRKVVRGLQGLPAIPPRRWRATLTRDLKAARDDRPAFVPARVWNNPAQGMMAEPCGWSGSADLFGLAPAIALLVRDQPTEIAPAGSAVDVIFISTDA